MATPSPRRFLNREDVLLFLSSVFLGIAVAAAFSAYRAVNAGGDATSERLADFAANLLWPGVLIFAAVAAVVWFGWKANID